MRKFYKHSALMLTVAGLSMGIAGCGAPAQPDAVASEEYEGVAEGDDLSGEEIEEAVPGVEAAYPEGGTPNTADLDGEGDDNIEVSEIDDPEKREDPPR